MKTEDFTTAPEICGCVGCHFAPKGRPCTITRYNLILVNSLDLIHGDCYDKNHIYILKPTENEK